MANNNKVPTKLLWMDLEMTGLDSTEDVILEVGAKVTDFDFNTLAVYESCVSHDRELVEERMSHNLWWQDYPENKKEFIDKLHEGKPQAEVEQELIKLLDEHFGDEPAILAGNSIHIDRSFIKHRMPLLDQRLHYRMLDVTSWKTVMEAKFGLSYEKKEHHRATDDVDESILELKYYLERFKNDA